MSDLPTGWVVATLEALASAEPRSITDGPFGSNLKSAHYTEIGPRVVRLQNIGFGEFRDERAHISGAHYESLRAHAVECNDLLVASLGSDLPRNCLVPRGVSPAIVKADCIRVRLHSEVDPKYVNYALQRPSLRKYTQDQIHGVGRPRIGMKGVRTLSVPLCPLPEQRRIVAAIEEHFSRLDAAEADLRGALARCDALTKSILISAIPVGDLPDEWELVTVDQAGHTELGRQRSPKYHDGDSMRPYLRVANVFEDRLELDDVMEMDFDDAAWAKYRLVENDILLNEGQSPRLVGRPAMYRGLPADVAFTNSLIRFQGHDNVDPEWALLVFRRHLHARRFMQEASITTNIAHLALKRFRTVEFPRPPLSVQRHLVAKMHADLDSAARMRDEVDGQLKKVAVARRSVLATAFSGRLLPQDRSAEPASALLERIAAERAAAKNARKKNVAK